MYVMGSGMSKISIERKSNIFTISGTFKIMLDGKQIDTIKNGETKAIEVTPGSHAVKVGSSNMLEFTIAKDDRVHLTLSLNFGLFSFIYMFIYILLVSFILFSIMFFPTAKFELIFLRGGVLVGASIVNSVILKKLFVLSKRGIISVLD